MRFQYFINDFDPEKAEEVGYIELDPSLAQVGSTFVLDATRNAVVRATGFPKRMLMVEVCRAF